MRKFVLSGFVLAISSVNLIAVPAPTEQKPTEPTEEQLADAKKAYAELGATYYCTTHPQTGQKSHRFIFLMLDETTDAVLKKLPDPPFRFGLALGRTHVTDAGMKDLKELKNLTNLYLYATHVTDIGLKELKGMKNLTHLDLRSTQVTDAGLKELKELKKLAGLSLEKTLVTNAGLKELKEFKNLKQLDLSLTQVTDEGVKELKEALPNCKINTISQIEIPRQPGK